MRERHHRENASENATVLYRHHHHHGEDDDGAGIRVFAVLFPLCCIFVLVIATGIAVPLLYYYHLNPDLTQCATAANCGTDARCWECRHERPPRAREYCYVNLTAVGTECDDLNSSTVGDACNIDGSCSGVQCLLDEHCEQPSDQCSVATCVNETCVTAVAVGIACDDLNASTVGDTCNLDGSCTGVQCLLDEDCAQPPDQCSFATCVNETCVNETAVGLACDDLNSTTVGDECREDGSCTGVQCFLDVHCVQSLDLCNFSACINDTCVEDMRPDGFVCSPNGTCQNGTCVENVECVNATTDCPLYVPPVLNITEGSPLPVLLGLAGDFAILAKTGITTVGATSVTGNMGVSPIAASAITGFALVLDGSGVFSTSALVVGRVYASDYAPPTPGMLTTAVLNMQAAYVDAAGRAPDVTELGGGTLSGQTLVAGVYAWSTAVTITGSITLSGTASDVWIFQMAQTLDISSGVEIILSGGAIAQNVFWQVAGVVSVGTTVQLEGIVLGMTTIALTAGGAINGKLLSQTAVTLSGETVVDVPVPLDSCMVAECNATICTYVPCLLA